MQNGTSDFAPAKLCRKPRRIFRGGAVSRASRCAAQHNAFSTHLSQTGLEHSKHPFTPEPFDFRSRRFCDDAQALQEETGCSLVLCRQELFIAEGDYLEARAMLLARAGAPLQRTGLH